MFSLIPPSSPMRSIPKEAEAAPEIERARGRGLRRSPEEGPGSVHDARHTRAQKSRRISGKVLPSTLSPKP